jgi:hypothetical protein
VKRFVASVFALAAAVAATTSAAPASDLVIRPGQGIGKFQLGMTEAELRRAVGRPRYVVPRAPTFGLRTVEYQYGLGAEYIAILVGRPGRLRVTRISTILRRERTPRGIGPGSLERTLLRAHPGSRCTPLRMESYKGIYQYLATLSRTCTLVTASGRRTIFRTAWAQPARRPGQPTIRANIPNYLRYARVAEVIVARS